MAVKEYTRIEMEKLKSLVGSYIYSTEDSGIDTEVMRKANTLQALFSDNKLGLDISIPKLVVVGAQSAAKSSVLNAIIQYDILPTDRAMCTRVAMQIQLVNDPSKNSVCFYLVESGELHLKKTTQLTDAAAVSNDIQHFTHVLAGTQKGISMRELVVRISSPTVPNLIVTDCPGLVQIACTDQGQPADIKDQIRTLIKQQIADESTVIIAVMPSRDDLEADPCLEVVAECDPTFQRTLGVLTKPDLVQPGSNCLQNYLTGQNISQNLTLHHGYFSVKLGGNPLYTHAERLNEEKTFFSNLPDYKTFQHRTGVENLTKALSKIMKTKLEQALPSLASEVEDALSGVNKEIAQLGGHLPATSEAQALFISNLVAVIARRFVENIEYAVSARNYGRKLKETFSAHRDDITENDFTEHVDDEYISEVTLNSNGNKMSTQYKTVEILESIVLDPSKAILQKFVAPSFELVERVQALLLELLAECLAAHAERFQNLVAEATQAVTRELDGYSALCKERIVEAVDVEAAYVWTNNEAFLDMLEQNAGRKSFEQSQVMRDIVKGYVDTVKVSLNNQVPKLVMHHVVKRIEHKLHHVLTNVTSQPGGDNLERWLDEDLEVVAKRRTLIAKQTALVEARRVLGKGEESRVS